MITINSPIVGTGGTLEEALAFLVNPDDQDIAYVHGLYERCQPAMISFAVAFAQFCHETANGSSPRWLTDRNPAGLLVSSDSDPNPATLTGDEAAHAHTWALACALYHSHTGVGAEIPKLKTFYERWQSKYDDPKCPTVRTIADLGTHYTDSQGEPQATWGWDINYAPQIAAKANAIFKEESVSDVTFGRVPYPSVIQSHLPASNPWVQESGAPDVPDAVVWHRMVGTFRGTDGYFHGGNAATCYGVGCAATDGQADAGKIFEWIAPRTGWYGESSGPVSSPYGDGLALVNKVGIQSVNRVTKAIEISGQYDTPLDDACRSSVIAMTAYWADQKRIPWDSFPAVPGENRSFVCWHQEFCIGTGKVCPGQVVMDETPAMIAAVASVLKHWQTLGQPAPKPPAPVPSVPWEPTDVGVRDLHGTKCIAFLGDATARRNVPIRSAADSTAPTIATVNQGEHVTLRGTVRTKKGRWALVDMGEIGVGRAPLSAFTGPWPVL